MSAYISDAVCYDLANINIFVLWFYLHVLNRYSWHMNNETVSVGDTADSLLYTPVPTVGWGIGGTLDQLKPKVPESGQIFIGGGVCWGYSGPTQIQKSLNLAKLSFRGRGRGYSGPTQTQNP